MVRNPIIGLGGCSTREFYIFLCCVTALILIGCSRENYANKIPNTIDFDNIKSEKLSSCQSEFSEIVKIQQSGLSTVVHNGNWSIEATKLLSSSKNATKAIIYISGGPNANPISKDTQKHLRKIYGDYADLYVITYSGSKIDDERYVERLEKYGLQSFECDADLIKNYINSILGAYSNDNIFIHSSSFSALLSIVIYSESSVGGLILTAPWTHYLSPKDIVQKNVSTFYNGKIQNIDKTDLEIIISQVHERYLHINTDKKIYSGLFYLKNYRDYINYSDRNILVIGAEFENRQNIEDTIKYFENNVCKIKILKGMIHEVVLVHSETAKLIQEFLNEQEC